METQKMDLFNERIQRINDAVALKETAKLPVVPMFDGVMYRLFGSSYRDSYYDFRKCGNAVIKFYEQYPVDAQLWLGFISGKANEIAGNTFIDWPGRPGTKISEHSTHQVLERELMYPEEYPELLKDFTGFMQNKYVPRMFSNLKGFTNIKYRPANVLNTAYFMGSLYSSEALEAYKTLTEIAKLDAEAAVVTNEFYGKLADMGIPPFITGISQVPFDILGDYFRGTVGMMEDLFEYSDEIEAVCEMFAEQQIEGLQYFRSAQLPVRRVGFFLHKGMDGFMSPAQYERLYWKPLKKIMNALIDMDVTPYIFTEGKYNTRLEQLTDVPKGKVIYHFEDVDMKQAKKIVGSVACISGNLPSAMLEFGKKEEVVNYCKYLIDTCAPGGGYIFDTSSSLENATKENLDAMFNTLETYR